MSIGPGIRLVSQNETDDHVNSMPELEVVIEVDGFKQPIKFQVAYGRRLDVLKMQMLEKTKILCQNCIAFQSVRQNLSFDFQLQNGIGMLKENIKMRTLVNIPEVNHKLTMYKLGKCIAIGGFSKVYIVRSLYDGHFYAAKFMDRSRFPGQQRRKLVLNQRDINQQIDHPFMVRMHDFIQTNNFYVFIMEYCPGGELFSLLREIRRMTEQQARPYFIEILLAIEYLHQLGIVYRDLKPENILIDRQGHAKITDFGLAKLTREKTYSYCGSIEYMPPEVILNNGHSFSADYYSLGVLLYQLLAGCPPFYNPNFTEEQTKQLIVQREVQFNENLGLSKEVKHMIASLLSKTPQNRLGNHGGVKEIKCHPWVGWIDKERYMSGGYVMPFERNLSMIDFDCEELGESENRFTIKIGIEYKLQKIMERKRVVSRKRQENKNIQRRELGRRVSYTAAKENRCSLESRESYRSRTKSPFPLSNKENFQKKPIKIKHSLTSSCKRLQFGLKTNECSSSKLLRKSSPQLQPNAKWQKYLKTEKCQAGAPFGFRFKPKYLQMKTQTQQNLRYSGSPYFQKHFEGGLKKRGKPKPRKYFEQIKAQ